jgi:large subunit ribosomal protein L29
MKQTEILELTDQELKEKLKSMEEEFAQLLLQHSISQLENPMRIRTMRRAIARLQTNLRKRELEAIS